MKTAIRWALLLVCLFTAISLYSYGNTMGMFAFVLLGFAFEAAFWLGLFPLKRRSKNN